MPVATTDPTVFAKAGDVVTTESGRFVCRVSRAIRRGDPVDANVFVGWGIEPVKNGDRIPFADEGRDLWCRKFDGTIQLHVNGQWLP